MKHISIGKIILCIFLILFISVQNGITAFNYKNIASPEIVALGSAYTGCAEDINCMFDNIAGLGLLKEINISLNYARLLWGLDYDGVGQFSGAFNYPVISIVNIGFSYYKLFTERYSENYLTFGIGRRITPDLTVGVSCNYLFWDSSAVKWFDIGDVEEDLNGNTFSFDFGLLYALLDTFKTGIFFQNINQPYVNSDKSGINEKLDYSAKIGFCYTDNEWRLLIDLCYTGFSFKKKGINNRVSEKQIGIERSFLNKFLFVRCGINYYHITEGLNFSMGLGLDVKKYWKYPIIIDYAVSIPINSIKGTYGSHYMGLNYKF